MTPSARRADQRDRLARPDAERFQRGVDAVLALVGHGFGYHFGLVAQMLSQNADDRFPVPFLERHHQAAMVIDRFIPTLLGLLRHIAHAVDAYHQRVVKRGERLVSGDREKRLVDCPIELDVRCPFTLLVMLDHRVVQIHQLGEFALLDLCSGEFPCEGLEHSHDRE